MLAAWQKISKRELFDIFGLAALNSTPSISFTAALKMLS